MIIGYLDPTLILSRTKAQAVQDLGLRVQLQALGV